MSTLIDAVKSKYGSAARSDLSSDHAGVRAVAEAFGYSAEELTSVPAGANLGLSCGNPTATAHLRAGEVVVDLGSGGGLDVFLAARQVGPTGRAIGVDMTPAMVERARANAARAGLANVEFHLATIDRLPLPDASPDASVDVVISNCVINLAPDKDAVFREIARVLRPGGRVAVSDIALKKPLPADLAQSVMAYVGCIAGAIPVGQYTAGLRAAGFADVAVVDGGSDLNAYAKVENQSACCAPPMVTSSTLPIATDGGGDCCGADAKADRADRAVHDGLADLLRRHDVNEYAASVRVYAVRPA